MDSKTSSSAAALFSWLRPTKAPYHLMAISAIFTLSAITSFARVSDSRWEVIFAINALVLFLSICLAIIPQDIDEEDYDKQLRLARCLGISSATICFIFAEQVLASDYYYRIVWVAGFQIFLFFVYMIISIFKKTPTNISAKKRTNNLQLSLITTSLLVGIVFNSVKAVRDTNEKNEWVYYILITSWLICIVAWIKQLISLFEVKLDVSKMEE